jgi:tetratricopeptide (TPR) repeat protein
MQFEKRGALRLGFGVSVTRIFEKAQVTISAKGRGLFSRIKTLSPSKPFRAEIDLPRGMAETDVSLRVLDENKRELVAFQPKVHVRGQVPPPATEPLPPDRISSADELFITGLHLEQYRHATRCPTNYWCEALRRDPLDSRCNNAMGLWHLRRGESDLAEKFFRRTVERLTQRNANPYDGEAFYNLGLCLRRQDREREAYDAFYKATWNQAWQAASYHALAELDCRFSNWPAAFDHLEHSLRANSDNLRARNLKVIVLRKLRRDEEADNLLQETLALDPLDWWARWLRQEGINCDTQTRLDIAHDLSCAGFYREAIELLRQCRFNVRDLPDQNWGARPLVFYTIAWLWGKLGVQKAALAAGKRAAAEPPDYCFPSRLEELEILEFAMRTNPKDARAPYYLGNLLYDRRRHQEAMCYWEKSARLDPGFSIVWRNLGIGYFNVFHNPNLARKAYEKAFRANQKDARLLYERDQLWKRLGESPAIRLREMERHRALVNLRDDLTVEFCALLNQTGQHEQALHVLTGRKFQPWEGGEGGALAQHVRSHQGLGRQALAVGEGDKARVHFESALAAPQNLGEARHVLANQSDIRCWLGCALTALGQTAKARESWRAAASFTGDFQEMRVRAFSEMTFYSAMALEKLGQRAKAKKLLRALLQYAMKLEKAPATIDYFATSLPTMLLFEDDLTARQRTSALFLQAQAQLGLGRKAKVKLLLRQVLRRDPNHPLAADFGSSVSQK